MSLLRVVLVLSLATLPYAQETNWPQWRGPLGTGEAPDADPPIEWSETNNVRRTV